MEYDKLSALHCGIQVLCSVICCTFGKYSTLSCIMCVQYIQKIHILHSAVLKTIDSMAF